MAEHPNPLLQAPSVRAEMLISRPAAQVYQAFVDPAITTRFWFSRASGPLQMGSTVTWFEWFVAAAPYAAIMSVILYFVCMKVLPPEMMEVEGGDAAVRKAVKEMGPMTAPEKKLLAISCGLLLFWVTEKILHPIDTTTTTIIAATLMMLPGIGIMTWKEAPWLANEISVGLGLAGMTVFLVFAILALFLIVIHIGFASATAVASSMIPIVIAILQSLGIEGLNIVSITMVLQFVVSFGFILPVNSPQGILAFATDTFTARDCIRVGLPLTIIGYLLLLLFAQTYWRALGIF